jgi:glutamine amidotransferase
VKQAVGAIPTFSHYSEDFLAAIEDGVIAATQFHPEKSGDAGIRLIKNWVQTL